MEKNVLIAAIPKDEGFSKEVNPHYSCLGPAFKIYVVIIGNEGETSWCWHILNSHYSLSPPQFHMLSNVGKRLEPKQSSFWKYECFSIAILG